MISIHCDAMLLSEYLKKTVEGKVNKVIFLRLYDEEIRKGENMDATEFIGGQFLKAENIDELPKKTLTIRDVTAMELNEKQKLVVSFEETTFQLVLNTINTKKLIDGTGTSETDKWTGKKITLMTREVEFGGKLVNAIRIQKVK